MRLQIRQITMRWVVGVVAAQALMVPINVTSCPAATRNDSEFTLSAPDLVVATWGDDNNSGTEQRPLASLKRASMRASPGDTVLLRGGIYRDRQVIERGGLELAPVLFAAWPGETPIIDGSEVELKASQGLVQVNASDVIVDGIEIRHSSSRGFQVYDSDRVTLRRSYVHHIASKGFSGSGDDLVVEGNVFENLVLQNINGEGPRPWPAGIASWHRPDGEPLSGLVIRDNQISRVWGECVGLVFTDGAQVQANTISDCYSVGVYLDNARNSSVDRNRIFTSSDEFQRIDNQRSMIGVNIAVEHYDSSELIPASNIVIANNLLLSLDRGVGFYNDPDNRSNSNYYEQVVVAHNVVCDTKHAAVHIHADGLGEKSGTVGANNILANNFLCAALEKSPNSVISIAQPARWLVDYNAYRDAAPELAGANHLQVGTQFTADAADGLAAWQIPADSPLRTSGITLPGVAEDAFCNPRPEQRPSIGLHEYID